MKKYFYSASLLLLLLACNAQNGTQEAASTAKAVPQGIQDVDVAAFKAKMQDENVVLLDVRTAPEVAAGKIAGALEINVLEDDFQAKVDALDKDKTYLVYCKAGSRSARACKIMEDAGFKDLYNLKGGFTAWEAQDK
jgi:rhodanese-related sulfurtransferase